jgi:hypothetical protein
MIFIVIIIVNIIIIAANDIHRFLDIFSKSIVSFEEISMQECV